MITSAPSCSELSQNGSSPVQRGGFVRGSKECRLCALVLAHGTTFCEGTVSPKIGKLNSLVTSRRSSVEAHPSALKAAFGRGARSHGRHLQTSQTTKLNTLVRRPNA